MSSDKNIISNFDIKCDMNEMATGIIKIKELSKMLKTYSNDTVRIAVSNATKEVIHDVADMTEHICNAQIEVNKQNKYHIIHR